MNTLLPNVAIPVKVERPLTLMEFDSRPPVTTLIPPLYVASCANVATPLTFKLSNSVCPSTSSPALASISLLNVAIPVTVKSEKVLPLPVTTTVVEVLFQI